MSLLENHCPECGHYESECSCIDGSDGERECTKCGDSFNLEEGGLDYDVSWDGSLCLRCEDD